MERFSLVGRKEDISSSIRGKKTTSKHRDLMKQFYAVRTIHGDGNCFYRAFCFAHLESVLHSCRALQRLREKLLQSSKTLVSVGFPERSFSHHLNRYLDVVEKCQAEESENTLYRLFNERRISDSMVQYLRLLTSAHLQIHSDFFSNFVEAPDLEDYCHREVEVMAMESDHVDILALTQALDVGIHIVSLETDEPQLAHHIVPEGAEPSLHLLYQMSHYSILYQRPEI